LVEWYRTTCGEMCLSATSCTTNLTGPRSNPGLRGEKPATNRLTHGTAKKHEMHLNYMQKVRYYLTVTTDSLSSKGQPVNTTNNALYYTYAYTNT